MIAKRYHIIRKMTFIISTLKVYLNKERTIHMHYMEEKIALHTNFQ